MCYHVRSKQLAENRPGLGSYTSCWLALERSRQWMVVEHWCCAVNLESENSLVRQDDASYKYHENEGVIGWILLVLRHGPGPATFRHSETTRTFDQGTGISRCRVQRCEAVTRCWAGWVFMAGSCGLFSPLRERLGEDSLCLRGQELTVSGCFWNCVLDSETCLCKNGADQKWQSYWR